MTDADRLRAEGAMVTLAGNQVPVRFSNRALAELEKRFGSLMAFQDALDSVLQNSLRGPIATVCLGALTAAMAGPRTSWPEERIEAAMKLEEFPAYLDAITEAWNQLWATSGQESNGQGNADGTPESTSPGSATSSSPSSSSTAPPTSSGT